PDKTRLRQDPLEVGPQLVVDVVVELRCTFGGRSIVPDLVVLASAQIPTDSNGDISSAGLDHAPEWMIEILSPDQSQMKVTRNILHSLRHGGRMGWLVDPIERVVLIYRPDALPDELTDGDLLPVLTGIELTLSAGQMFDWLKVARS
ncbi:MAG: Uma2 family endonuclease, partial [Cyanobacteria bacterium P01_F01_bin.42]